MLGSRDLELRWLLCLLVTISRAFMGQEDSPSAISVALDLCSSGLSSTTFPLLAGMCWCFVSPRSHHPTNPNAGQAAAA